MADFIFLGSKVTADSDRSHKIKRHLLLGRKAMTNLGSVLKHRVISLFTSIHVVKAMAFFISHVWTLELDHKEGWAPKNWCFPTVVLERTLKSPLDSKEIKPVDPNGKQLWIFIGRTDADASYFGHLMRRDDSLEKPWCRERLNDGGVEGDKGWDGWMSLAQWTWVWASSGRQSRTGKPGMLQFMESKRIRHSLGLNNRNNPFHWTSEALCLICVAFPTGFYYPL